MAFTPEEVKIIEYGKAKGKTADQITSAVSKFRLAQPTPQPPPAGYASTVASNIGNDINQRTDNVSNILNRKDTGTVEKGLQVFGQGAGAAANAAETVVGQIPGVKQATQKVGEGINWLATSDWSPIKHLGDMIGSSKTLQEVTQLYDNDPNFRDTVDAVANTARLGMDVQTAVDSVNFAKNVTNKVLDSIKGTPKVTVGGKTLTLDQVHSPEGTKLFETLSPADQQTFTDFDKLHSAKLSLDNAIKAKAPAEDVSMLRETYNKELANSSGASNISGVGEASLIPKEISGTARSVTKDILPTVDRVVNTEVTKALDLTQGDVKNIKLSTGNDVGQFIADKNLIGENLAETTKKVNNFYKENYAKVRTEINAVKATYDPVEIPRYKEALTQIKKQIEGTPGLQEVNAEVDKLITKSKPNLADVQRTKELLDEQFSLYKATGDVKEGVTKQGLTEIRRDLKQWIEGEVKDRTGVDIAELNNNVQTARSIQDAVETRSTRNSTRGMITPSDIITFMTGSAFASPVGGAVAVILKKIYQSPTFKLKFAKFLDGMSDTGKLKLLRDFKQGVVPEEAQSLLNIESNSSKTPQMETKTREMKTSNSSIDTSIPQKSNLNKGEIPKTIVKGVMIKAPALKTIPQITDSPISAKGVVPIDSIKNAVAYRETRGSKTPYTAINTNSGGSKDYGKYQVNQAMLDTYYEKLMGEKTTPEKFLKSPSKQEEFFVKMYNHAVKDLGVKTEKTFLTLWHGNGFSDISKKAIQKLQQSKEMQGYINTR